MNPNVGWITQTPSLLSKLPVPNQEEIQSIGGWRQACQRAYKYLSEIKSRAKREIVSTSDRKSNILPLLILDNPLDFVQEALRLTRSSLPFSVVPSLKDALIWQRYIFVSILASFPLRARTMRSITYHHDQKGELALRDGVWSLSIPNSKLKNGQANSSLKREEVISIRLSGRRWFDRLLPDLERFLTFYRPLLCQNNSFLFASFEGNLRNMSYDMAISWSREYLSQYSKVGVYIPGLRPFGPHSFRDIVATHFVQHGEYEKAAAALMEDVRTVRRHYAHDPMHRQVGRAFGYLDETVKPRPSPFS
ncbi:hypothetical protein K7W42_18870 [Deinococcus sp. HMF7604]|uniref:hypothetical protein n=1 Tax=Deinococcus betulae TaxID=2873312 RepID=UPI001CCC27B1|nr:hypothetical protein [Deinococcus betulae]MBZ9752906.1 hypothetical protein [Deinococcus betulae]